MGSRQRSERGPVDDPGERRRRRARLGKLLRRAGETERAVAARLRAHLAEVADELVDLAAVVGDERDDAADPLRLGPLAALEALDEAVEQLVAASPGGREPCSAVARRRPGARSAPAARDARARRRSGCAPRRGRPRPRRDRGSSTCARSCRSRRGGAGSRPGRDRRPRTRRRTSRSRAGSCSRRRTAFPAAARPSSSR